MRLDQYLQEKHNLESRHQAQRLIKEGFVHVNEKQIQKPGHVVSPADNVEVKDWSILKYVSRAGLKLEHAISQTQLQVEGLTCLDVGQSTGGFSDCLLQKGAKRVVGIEVGHSQLHEKLRHHPQIQSYEKTHILEFQTDEKFDLIVVDLSFISIQKVLPYIVKNLLPKNAKLLCLIKPQFELGAANLNKAGLVKDRQNYESLEKAIKNHVKDLELHLIDYFPSHPPGTDGNHEFFLYAEKS